MSRLFIAGLSFVLTTANGADAQIIGKQQPRVAQSAPSAGEPFRTIDELLEVLPASAIPGRMADWTDAQVAVTNKSLQSRLRRPIEWALLVKEVRLIRGRIYVMGTSFEGDRYWLGPPWCLIAEDQVEPVGKIRVGDAVLMQGIIGHCEFRKRSDAVYLQVDLHEARYVGPVDRSRIPGIERLKNLQDKAEDRGGGAFVEALPAIPDSITAAPFVRNHTSISGLIVQDTNAGYVGSRMEILAIVAPRAGDGYGRLMRSVGADMTTSFEEALRVVRVDHPRWETGEVQVSFSDKYTPKDGGSAGAAFAVLIASLLEGFEIDPHYAMTGDITVDGKVRAVGAVGSKIRGAAADGMTIVAVPAENTDVVTDFAVLEGVETLLKTQVIAVETIEQAKALARSDRTAEVAEAVELFATLMDADPWRPTAERLATLEKVIELSPNHLSAQLLLKAARNQLPRTLGAATSLNEAFIAIRPIAPDGLEDKLRNKTLDRRVVADLKVRLRKVQLLSHPKARPMVEALLAYVNQVEMASRRTLSNDTVERINKTLHDIARESETLGADRELIEEILR